VTANIIPTEPSPVGGRKILLSLPIEGSFSGPVTMNWFLASIPMLVIHVECIPISMWRIGSFDIPDKSNSQVKINTNRTEIDRTAFFISA
jgi:hypothetical protein